MSLRERLIASGNIRPVESLGGDAYGALRRQLVEDGRISAPNDTGADYLACYWAMMLKWYEKDSRRWESLRKYASGWH